MENIIKKVGGKKSNICWYAIVSSVALIAGLIGIMLSLDMGDDGIFIIFVCVLLILVGAVMFLRLYTTSRNFVCVCDDRVYGVGGKANMMLPQPFDFKISEITEVSKGAYLFIESRSIKVPCDVQDAQEICDLINKQIQASR